MEYAIIFAIFIAGIYFVTSSCKEVGPLDEIATKDEIKRLNKSIDDLDRIKDEILAELRK